MIILMVRKFVGLEQYFKGGKMTLKDEIIKWIKDCDPDYESEYAGRMERWCFFCGAYNEPRKGTSHKKECLWFRAHQEEL